MLTRLGLRKSGKGGRINNGQESKRAADARAKALASTLRKLQAKGIVSSNAIARELNAREIPTAHGGKWHHASVKRMLQRLEKLDRAPKSRHRR
jgi:Recombinase